MALLCRELESDDNVADVAVAVAVAVVAAAVAVAVTSLSS